MSTPKPEVFISFASRDGECFAKAVLVRLQRESPALGLWKDHLSLEGGRGWWDQIEAALNQARFLVLILTPAVLSEKLAPVVPKGAQARATAGRLDLPGHGGPEGAYRPAAVPPLAGEADEDDFLRLPPHLARAVGPAARRS